MTSFETKSVGKNLYKVTINGIEQPRIYTIEEIGDIYARNWSPIKNKEKIYKGMTLNTGAWIYGKLIYKNGEPVLKDEKDNYELKIIPETLTEVNE